MIKSQMVKELEFVLSKDELPYQEVLNDFCHSAYIGILTYNISQNHESLLNKIQELDEDTEVEIISNIPGRFETYYGESGREKARRNIRIFQNKLNPERFTQKLETFFCFSNHSKIIMTNNLAYIGSANFSEESAKSFEAGFITHDSNFIQFLKQEVFSLIKNESEEYFDDDDLMELRLYVLDSLSKLAKIKYELHDIFFTYENHHGVEGESYNFQSDMFSLGDLSGLNELTYYIEDLVNLLEFNDSAKCIATLISKEDCARIHELLLYGSNLYKLAEFYVEDFVDDFLIEDPMPADEEHLDEKIEKANEEGMLILEDLTYQAKGDIDFLESLINNLLSQLEMTRCEFTKLLKPNPEVDNT